MSLSFDQWQRLAAEALLHFLWQGLLIAFLTDGTLRLLAARPANVRYAVGLGGLLAMAVAPFVTIAVLMPASTVASPATVVVTSPEAFSKRSTPTALAREVFAPTSQIDEPSPVLATYPFWIFSGWCLGVVLLGSRLLIGFIGMYRWSWPRTELPAELLQVARRLANTLKLACPRVYLSTRVPEALALGLLRPIVLIPAAWLTDLPLPMLEAVLAHELAHLRRHDLMVNLLQRLVETLLFYHPAVWWLSNRIRQERELCCDFLAVAATGDRIAYAQTLEQVARLGISHVEWSGAVAMGGRRMNLLQRVRYVLGAPTSCQNGSWLAGFLVVLAPALLCWFALSAKPALSSNENLLEEMTGMVVDEKGNPVPGARIQAVLEQDEVRQLTADPDGKFRVPLQWWSGIDSAVLLAKEPGRFGWYAFSRPSPMMKTQGFRITMLPLNRRVNGQLVDEKNAPLANIPVSLAFIGHGTNGWLSALNCGGRLDFISGKTNDAGRFQLEIPQTDNAEVCVNDPDWVAVRLAVTKEETNLGKITVGKAARIGGQVVETTTGKPLAGVRVGAQYVSDGATYPTAQWGEAVTNQEGRYLIGGLVPGQHNVIFLSPKNSKLVAPCNEGIIADVGKTVSANLSASEGRRLAGKVIDVDTGKPLPDYHVGYYGAERPRSGAACKMVRTNDQGRFEFYVSPGASYVYVAQGSQIQIDGSNRTVEIAPDRDYTDLILRASTKPVEGVFSGAMITEGRKKEEADQDFRLHLDLRTTNGKVVNGVRYHWIKDRHVTIMGIFSGNRYDDRFSESFAGGPYSLLIDADGFAPVLVKEFNFTRRMEPLVIDLQPAVYVPVRGRVLGADGKPLAGVRVRAGRAIAPESKEFPWGVEASTDAQGMYELKRLRAGEQLFVYADKKDIGGMNSAQFVLATNVPFQVPDLRIPQANQTLEGVVTNLKGTPLAGVLVQLSDGFPRRQGQDPDKKVKTDDAGQFRFEGLLPGMLWLRAEASGYQLFRPLETIAGVKNVQIFMGPSFDSK